MNLYAEHPALQGLSTEQLAELALYGLRYRALGAADVDFSDPSRLDVYWTGERLAKKSQGRLEGGTSQERPCGAPLQRSGRRLADTVQLRRDRPKTYMAQHQLLLDRHR